MGNHKYEVNFSPKTCNW